ncbi:MAG: peptide-methionine (S)-S-oxide reductase MsrA [Acidobacteria bacterium]|nr:peptide-methionine (S)-S-oxide reductase MsrA [Acidobacteriota bacterium]
MTRRRVATLIAIALLVFPTLARSQSTGRAVFAGGCFWTIEYEFERLPGVVKAVSGFSGGDHRFPTYDDVEGGRTGHLEAVEVTYDPRQIRYRELVDAFWRMIDPTDAAGQTCDRGNHYRSAVFVGDETQREAALASRAAIDTGPRRGRLVTPIRAEKPFWPAGAEHQDFYRTNAARYQLYRSLCGRDRVLAEVWADEGR